MWPPSGSTTIVLRRGSGDSQPSSSMYSLPGREDGSVTNSGQQHDGELTVRLAHRKSRPASRRRPPDEQRVAQLSSQKSRLA